ncbi:MAG: type II secretion system F family protein [Actinomycetota bacterium]|nr:type II secretion system F family protein [Actinomycetota bacterium]
MFKFFTSSNIKEKVRYLLLSTVFFVIIFSIVFISPLTAYAQESEDILIKDIDFDYYPRVDIYVNFEEDSLLGTTGLEQEDFVVLENGESVSNLSVRALGEIAEPIGVVLAVDTSGSMEGEPIGDAISAVSIFIGEMRDIDKTAALSFADSVITHSGFTSDHSELRDSISGIEAEGDTSLFDGIYTACGMFRSEDNIKHRYLIVLSDGADTASSHSVEEVIERAEQEEVSIYSIALLSPEYNLENIKYISESTGGELLTAVDSKELEELYKKISKRITNQYRISYTSLWPDAENIEISVGIEKMDTASSATTSYENPYYASPPKEVVFDSINYLFLNIFNSRWAKIVLFALVFISVSLFLYALVLFIPVRRRTLRDKAKGYGLEGREAEEEEEEEYGEEKERKGFLGWLIRIISKVATRRGFIELLESRLDRAGMKIRTGEFITLHLFAVVALGMIAYYFSRNPLITLLIVIIAVLSPFMLLNIKTAQRLKIFHEQLPDALQLISGSLKAGYSFNQALAMVVDESKPPLSEEFRRMLSEMRMGIQERKALENLTDRIKSEYFDWTVMAINVQREVGGNLSEVMATISDTIRERDRVMNRIKALTSEGKLSAIILIALPAVVGLLLAVLNREYISLLYTTKIGLLMMVGAVIMMIMGIIWILKIIQIKY